MRRTTIHFLTFLITMSCAWRADAAVPDKITVQGRLTDAAGTPLPAGNKTLSFSIHDAAAGGNRIWPGSATEDQLVTTGSDGLWTVFLGAVESLTEDVFADTTRWLEITVNDNVNPPETMPRIRLFTGPYAHRVATVDGATGGHINGKLNIGGNNTNPGSSAFVVGDFNDATGAGSVVIGGSGNQATTGPSAVVGGSGNTASGDHSFVTGESNTASGSWSSVTGGNDNTSSGNYATIGGGTANAASAYYATVGGGSSNVASSASATVGGGARNKARGEFSVVAGGGGTYVGDTNSAQGVSSTISGGAGNTARGQWSAIGGGYLNEADSVGTVGGGEYNVASGAFATVGGGGGTTFLMGNTATGATSTIGGGRGNVASGATSTIAGGYYSDATGNYSSIGGGFTNESGGIYATVPGGRSNQAVGNYSFAAGRYAIANHHGSFVWASGSDTSFESTAENQFLIRANGGVGIGTAAPEAPLHVFKGSAGNVTANGNAAAVLENDVECWMHILSPSGTQRGILFGEPGASLQGSIRYNPPGNEKGYHIRCGNNNVRVIIDSLGSITADGCIVGSNIACPSDGRFKRNIATLPNALETIARLRGVQYEWSRDQFPDREFPEGTQVGLIAQEVHDIVPQAVVQQQDGYLAVDYSRLVPLLIEGMKEQQREIDELRALLKQQSVTR